MNEGLQNILDNLDDGITLVDLGGKVLDCNRASLQLLNLTREELIGTNIYDVIVDEDRQKAVEGALRVLKTGRIVNQVRVKQKNKSYFWAEISVTALYDNNKQPVAFLGVTRDITERKKTQAELEDSKERLQNIIDAMNDGIALLGLDGKVVDCNQATLKQLNKNKEEVIGKKITDFIVSKNKESLMLDVQSRVRKEGKAIVEVQISGKGSPISVEISITVFCDAKKKPVGLIGVARDITERKKTEAELELYRKDLERLVVEKTAQLKKTERLATIGETAGMVGHNIRNPLQAIASDLYLIESDAASLPEDETKKSLQESVNGIEYNLYYIAKIVEDLQDYAKPQYPNKQKIEIGGVIEEVMKLVFVPSNLKVIIDIAKDFPKISADFSMLKRSLTNLVTNAIQAMPNGGQLTLRAQHKDAQAFITVEDTGVGIPEEVKPKLFEPMFTTKAKGQGLGLAVSKRLVEAQGGAISFESQKGKGTKFVISLPSN
jgi:PAS domain S-box-containing protein